MEPTRILILDTSPIRRGAQVFAVELADSLISQGHQVRRIYLFLPKEDPPVFTGAMDRVFDFQKGNAFEKFPTFQPGILRELGKEIHGFRPQFILCNGSRTLKYGAWIRIFGKSGGAKIVGRFIDDARYWNENGLKKWIYSFWLSRLDGMVAVSQSSLDSMIRHYNFTKPSRVIHRVFDPRKFENALNREEARKQLGLSENDEVLLFLGNLTTQKRPDRFLEIVKNLIETRPNLKALIVGDGPLRKDLEDRVQNAEYNEPTGDSTSVSRLPSSVSFKGYQQDVSPFLAAADILVLTSDTEGLPGVVLEAAHFEVPSVATEVGGIGECLIDGETGILIPSRSAPQFCQKINFLLDHPQDRIAMGERAKIFTSKHFRMDQVVDQYLDFFQSISPSQ